MAERVVVTGIGAVSPLGLNAEESWKNAVLGVSGVGPITLFDASDLNVRIAAEVKGFQPESFLPAREARRRDRFELFAAAAAKEAIEMAGLEVTEQNSGCIGVMMSSAIGGVYAFADAVEAVQENNPRKISPFTIPMMMSNGAAGLISIDYGIHGPALSVASACASGADGIGNAWLMLRAGLIDVAIAGGTEATITPVGLAAFDRLAAMTRRNEAYDQVPQPFDRNRDGLVMGEGAGVLVLETESHARQRGAAILAELAGYGSSSDGSHITAPLEDGSGAALAIQQALRNAGINPGEVDYINAHGTATRLNDLSETRAIKTAFGDLAYNIPVSSTKSMTGHMMGATGALEAVFGVQAIRDGVIPPTIHYEEPDPECDLDYVPNQARELPVRVVASNAFGFGGHNAVLVIRKYT